MHLLTPLGFAGDLQNFAKLLFRSVAHACRQFFVLGRSGVIPRWISGAGGKVIDRFDLHLHLLMREQNRAQHLIFGQFGRLRLDHEHRILRARNHHVELRALQGFEQRIQQVKVVCESHTIRADWSGKRYAGNRQRCGRPNHGNDVWVDLSIRRHYCGDDLHFV